MRREAQAGPKQIAIMRRASDQASFYHLGAGHERRGVSCVNYLGIRPAIQCRDAPDSSASWLILENQLARFHLCSLSHSRTSGGPNLLAPG